MPICEIDDCWNVFLSDATIARDVLVAASGQFLGQSPDAMAAVSYPAFSFMDRFFAAKNHIC